MQALQPPAFICGGTTELSLVCKDFASQHGMIESHWRDRHPQQLDPVLSATFRFKRVCSRCASPPAGAVPGLGEAIHPLPGPSPGFTDAEAGDEAGALSGPGVAASG